MFQPFERFKCEYIDRLITLDKKYVVSQLYNRAPRPPEGAGINLLFSDYKDLGQAKIHYKAVAGDKFASIIHLTNSIHKAKVEEMLTKGSRFTIYWNTVKSVAETKKIIDQKYKSNMRRYILTNTSWKIGADQSLKPSFEVTFGELFIILKWSGETLRIKFAEIENA